MPTGDNVTYISGTGHRPIPRIDDTGYRHTHTPQPRKPSGLDWSTLTRACTGCGQKSTELVTGRCPTCRGVAPAKATGVKVAKGGDTYGDNELTPEDLAAIFTARAHSSPDDDLADLEAEDPDVAAAAARLDDAVERVTHPDDHVVPAHLDPTRPDRKDTTVATQHFPAYIVDVAVVMRDSENHPDPAVRAARKTVANALVGLNKELLRYGDASSIPTPPPPPKRGPRAARYSGHLRIKELGTTAREIREWARSRGIDVPSHGTLPIAVIEAYATTHNTPTGATA